MCECGQWWPQTYTNTHTHTPDVPKRLLHAYCTRALSKYLTATWRPPLGPGLARVKLTGFCLCVCLCCSQLGTSAYLGASTRLKYARTVCDAFIKHANTVDVFAFYATSRWGLSERITECGRKAYVNHT